MMRDIFKALAEFEALFEEEYNLSLNEAMILCALEEAKEEMTSTALSARTGMAASHTSKVIRAVEEKGLIKRALGETDKRQMYFGLTPEGKKRLKELNLEKVKVPEMLKTLINK